MNDSEREILSRLPLGKGVRAVAFHAIGLVALEKPPGIRAHPNNSEIDLKALLACPYHLKEEYYSWRNRAGRVERLYLLNRLDAPTSGLMLASLNRASATLGRELLKNHAAYKKYFALVKGNYSGGKRVWRDRLRRERREEKIRVATGGGSKAATVVEKARRGGGSFACTLLELAPRTGFTHQLRVQCAERRFPIVGDAVYGDFTFNRAIRKGARWKRLFLHAAEISLPLDLNGKKEIFRAQSALPPEFLELLNWRGKT